MYEQNSGNIKLSAQILQVLPNMPSPANYGLWINDLPREEFPSQFFDASVTIHVRDLLTPDSQLDDRKAQELKAQLFHSFHDFYEGTIPPVLQPWIHPDSLTNIIQHELEHLIPLLEKYPNVVREATIDYTPVGCYDRQKIVAVNGLLNYDTTEITPYDYIMSFTEPTILSGPDIQGANTIAIRAQIDQPDLRSLVQKRIALRENVFYYAKQFQGLFENQN